MESVTLVVAVSEDPSDIPVLWRKEGRLLSVNISGKTMVVK